MNKLVGTIPNLTGWRPCYEDYFDLSVCIEEFWNHSCYSDKCQPDACKLCPDLCLTVITKREWVCNPSFRWGYCGRRVVEVWSPVLLEGFAITAFIVPALTLMINARVLSSIMDAFERCVPFVKLRYSSDDDAISRRLVAMASQLETAVFWGFHSPLLLPLGLLSFFSNFMVEYYLRPVGDDRLCQCLPVAWYLLFLPVLLCVGTSLLFYEAALDGREFVCAVSAAQVLGVMVFTLVAMHKAQRWRREHTNDKLLLGRLSFQSSCHTPSDTDTYYAMDADFS